jgi:Cu(I)/Ag(I) efflux system protein CusF
LKRQPSIGAHGGAGRAVILKPRFFTHDNRRFQMNTKIGTALILLAALHAAGAWAQQDKAASTQAAPAATPTLTDGEVRKVDKAAGKITLKHGEIKNLGMAPMSMVFQAKNPALLDKVKAGDKVRFTAAEINGVLTLMSIERTR